jgi:hypothetical protein
MALSDPALPYGLRDVRLTPINSDGSLGTPVDLPVSQTLSFSEAEEYEELRGDDRLVAVHGKGPTVEFDLEAGGISLEAWALMSGGTLAELGSTPTQTKSVTKLITQSRPYFRVEGQSINDVDGDTHVVIHKAKITDSIEGEFADGTFFVTKCSGQGLGNDDDELYTITWNETSSTIANGGINEIQLVVLNAATGGTFTLTYSAQTTAAIAYNAAASAVESALIALSNIGPTDVNVTGADGGPYYVEFQNSLGETNVALMTADNASLTGSGHVITVATLRAGVAP